MLFFTSLEEQSTIKNIYLSQDDRRAVLIDSDDHLTYINLDK